MKNNNQDSQNIEIWADLIHIKDLIIAIIICVALTMGGYLIAPTKAPYPLFFGLGGAIIGFVIASILIHPKRTLREVEEAEEQSE